MIFALYQYSNFGDLPACNSTNVGRYGRTNTLLHICRLEFQGSTNLYFLHLRRALQMARLTDIQTNSMIKPILVAKKTKKIPILDMVIHPATLATIVWKSWTQLPLAADIWYLATLHSDEASQGLFDEEDTKNDQDEKRKIVSTSQWGKSCKVILQIEKLFMSYKNW